MKIAVDPPLRVGRLRVYAVVQIETAAESHAGRLGGWGRKIPLALLIDDGATRRAWTPDGRRMHLDELARLYPGAQLPGWDPSPEP